MTASPLRLVLAEDGDLLRQGIVALLSGYPELEVVGECGSLPELVAVVNRTDPDVVLTDVRMPPGQSDEGIRAAAWLRQTHPRVGVVVLTQYAEVEYALDLITEELSRGNEVTLRRFGTFEVRISKAKVGRNPNKPGSEMRIPPRSVVRFKPGNELKSQVAAVLDKLGNDGDQPAS